jgi:hypothetical protein
LGSGSFTSGPVDKPYGEYTIIGDAFLIDSNTGLQRISAAPNPTSHNVVVQTDRISFNKLDLTGSVDVSFHNDGEIIYDAHLVLDEINPSGSEALDADGVSVDGKPFWNFGIIPAGKVTTARTLSISFSSDDNISIKGHIEFKERPFINMGGSIIHTDGFDGNDIKISSEYGEIVKNEVIAGVPDGRDLAETYDYLVGKNLLLVGCIIINGQEPESVINDLKSDSFLVKPEINPILKSDYFPDDPIYDPVMYPDGDERWAFERVEAVDAWDYYSDGVIDQAGDASVTNVALVIIDTGLIKHQDFNLDGTDSWVWDTFGENFINTSLPPVDDNGHGTRCAGIAGAMGNNTFGMAGMAWNPYFIPIKSHDSLGLASGYSFEQSIAQVRNIADPYPWVKFVVNMSFGAYYQNEPYYWMGAALDYADAIPNTIFCAAAGNHANNKNLASESFEISADNHYPAAYPACISVGASSRLQDAGLDKEVDTFETFGVWGTNWGDTVDICAPGSTSIYTTDNGSPIDFASNFGMTSASTPFVSGAAALLWSKNPMWPKDLVRQKIIYSADPMSLPAQKIGKLGSGRLNMFQALTSTARPRWAETFGGGSYDAGYDVACDNLGYVYVTGTFEGTVDFDPGTPVYERTANGADVYLSKFSVYGSHVWTRTWGGSEYRSYDHGDSIAIDSEGNIFVGAMIDIYRNQKAQLSKWDSDGNEILRGEWDAVEHIAVNVDDEDMILITGAFTGNFLNSPSYPSNGNADIYLMRFEIDVADLDILMICTWGGPEADISYDVASSSLEHIFVTGCFRNEVDFDPGFDEFNQTSEGFSDAFLLKLREDSDFQWVKTWGDIGCDVGRSLCVDDGNDIYVVGHFMDGEADTDYDIFLRKYTSTSTYLWQERWGGENLSDYGYGVAVYEDDYVYVTGRFQDTVDFDTSLLTDMHTAVNGDIYLSKFDTDGDYQWAKTWGGGGFDFGAGVATDAEGFIYLTGGFYGYVDFDPFAGEEWHLSNGSLDSFLCMFPPNP